MDGHAQRQSKGAMKNLGIMGGTNVGLVQIPFYNKNLNLYKVRVTALT